MNYLADINAPDQLPGSNQNGWNQGLPYRFVGSDFQSWKVFRLNVPSTSVNRCDKCHRMGVSSTNGAFNVGAGTADFFGPFATAPSQPSRNQNAKIWMTPASLAFDPLIYAEASKFQQCADKLFQFAAGTGPAPDPAGCSWTEQGQGSTCGGATVQGIINGATQADLPTTSRTDIVSPSGSCQPGAANCRVGFLYWTSIHGPFWQKSPGTVPITDPTYRGAFARIEVDPSSGLFQAHVLSDSTGYTLSAAPGGSFEGVGYDEFKSTPPVISGCSAGLYAIADVDGTHVSTSVTIGSANQYFETLTGMIGYVGQNTTNRFDVLRVQSTTSMFMSETHVIPAFPLTAGPMQAESFAGRCANWTPPCVSRNIYSQNDVLLLANPWPKSVRCFITGISGNWSRTQNGGTDEPYAQIYRDANGDYRLKVSPSTLDPLQNRVGAYASCVQL